MINAIRRWTRGQFFVATLIAFFAVMWALVFAAQTPSRGGARYLAVAIVFGWFAVAWVFFGRNRTD